MREQSVGIKHAIAFVGSFAMTLVIGFVWMTIAYPDVMGGQGTLARNESQQTRSVRSIAPNPSDGITEERPFATLGSNFALSFAAVKDQLNAFSQYFSRTDYEASTKLQNLEAISPEDRASGSVVQ